MKYEPTYHEDGTVTYWSVYEQRWIRHAQIVPNRELAAMPTDEREKIVTQTEDAQPNQPPGAALSALRSKTEKPCEQCGKKFTGYSHQKYCGSTCRSNARHQRKRLGATQ